jgi:hypothetical protein
MAVELRASLPGANRAEDRTRAIDISFRRRLPKCHFSIGCSPEIGENVGSPNLSTLQESRMNSHKNARLTQLGRVHLMQQIAHAGLRAAAAFAGSAFAAPELSLQANFWALKKPQGKVFPPRLRVLLQTPLRGGRRVPAIKPRPARNMAYV